MSECRIRRHRGQAALYFRLAAWPARPNITSTITSSSNLPCRTYDVTSRRGVTWTPLAASSSNNNSSRCNRRGLPPLATTGPFSPSPRPRAGTRRTRRRIRRHTRHIRRLRYTRGDRWRRLRAPSRRHTDSRPLTLRPPRCESISDSKSFVAGREMKERRRQLEKTRRWLIATCVETPTSVTRDGASRLPDIRISPYMSFLPVSSRLHFFYFSVSSFSIPRASHARWSSVKIGKRKKPIWCYQWNCR